MATIALFIARLLEIYSFIIWIRIMLSWINPFPAVGSFTYYLASIVDPYLNMFRSSRFRAGMLDFSPLIGIGLLTVVQSVFQIYGTYGMMTLSLIVMLFLNAFWSYGIQIFFTNSEYVAEVFNLCEGNREVVMVYWGSQKLIDVKGVVSMEVSD